MSEEARRAEILKVTWVGFFLNFVLSGGKLAAGILGKSGAMVADAVHSISDFATDIVVLFFVDISSKPKDDDHDYGHGKYETLATVLIGGALIAVAVGIFLNALALITDVFHGKIISRPGAVALVAALVSIVGKEFLYRYTVNTGKRLNSPAVVANAWHHRSDAFSSIGTFLGISGAYFLGERWVILDPIAAIIVSLLIAKTALEIILPGLNELLETSLPKAVEEEIFSVIRSFPEVEDPHNLKTRSIGTGFAIEVHVRVSGAMTVAGSHRITVQMERKIREKFGDRTQVIIHVEPKKSTTP